MRYGSLFSGTGALDMGVQSVLGGTTAWHSDVEPGPRAILAHHWPDAPNIGDITTVDWAAVEPVDVITGGSPCTDVSHAGKRAGMREGTRSGLWASMCDAIGIIRPRLVVWENVTGAHSAGADSNVGLCPLGMGHGSGVSLRATGRVVGDLAEMGFNSWWCTIRAADAGAPHGRSRVFVFAWPADSESVPWGVEHGDDVRAGWSTGRHRPPAGRGAAADPGSLGRDGGPGVQRAGRSQGVRGEEIHHPGDVHRAPSVAADPDGLGPHGAGDARGRGAGPADGGVVAPRLFPTPRASDGTKGGPNQRGSSGDLMLWGVYEPAIRRWEQVVGRPAPPPTQTGKRGGPQLSPAFTEWLMGLPAGHVTDPAIGLTRNVQLRALGNGVVPAQCALATRAWLHYIQSERSAS